MMRDRILSMVMLAAALGAGPVAAAPGPEMVRIPGGSYAPLFSNGRAVVAVAPFAMDRAPVTRADFAAFLRAHPEWRRDRVRRAFAGPGYLAGWTGPTEPGQGGAVATEVSWFAARAYCAGRRKRLPSTDEWEYVARASETRRDASRDPAFMQRLLTLYTAPRRAAPLPGSGFRNVYGVEDLHGVVWEWVEDFGSLLVSDDSRSTSGRDHQLFCAAGVVNATDPGNYPGFMRYGMRAALEGRTTGGGLGFRCAQGV